MNEYFCFNIFAQGFFNCIFMTGGAITMKRLITFLIILISFHQAILSQNQWHTSSKKAIKYMESGLKNMNLIYFDLAISDFNNAIKADKKFVEAYLGLGQLYEELKEYDLALEYYKKGHEIKPGLYNQTLYSLGRAYFYSGLYLEAKKAFEDFLKQKGISSKNKSRVSGYLKNCEFAITAKENPLPFDPINLGDSINTIFHEYWPSLSADDEVLVFTSRIPIDTAMKNSIGNWQEDFFKSRTQNGQWQKAKSLGSPINTLDNEGAQSLSADGKTLYFTACNREDGKGKCDIYFSEYTGEAWTEPKNIGSPVNSGFSEKQPSISPNGDELYFVSDRTGSLGKFDIWKSKRMADGTWGVPVNLGDSVNTSEDEQSPFIHADNKTLYFTSKGHPGMGGYDLYLSRLKEDDTWSEPLNLGYPINTQFDEMGLCVNAKGNKGFFSSDRNNEKGLDIFEFEMPAVLKPFEVSYMKGKIYDAETKNNLRASFQVINIFTGDTVSASYSSETDGTFLITIPTDTEYALNVMKKGYLFYSDHFSFEGMHSLKEPLKKNIPLQPVRLNNYIILNNIFYDSDSYTLKNQSQIELDKIFEFLSLNKNVSVEIGGHTDNTGSSEYNLELSRKRAEEVVLYLQKKGISVERIVAQGYGENAPVESNDTLEGRAKNRRTELKIIEIK